MATINFFVQSKTNPSGIYVRLREGISIDAKAKTKFAINPIDWSKKGQPKNLKDEGFKALNSDLLKLKSSILSYYNKCVDIEPINSAWLKNFLNPKVKINVAPSTLLDYFDYYISQEISLKKASKTKLNTIKSHVNGFQKEMNTVFFIKNVDEGFKVEFLKYCIKNGYAQNTISKYFHLIKTMCYHAESKGIDVSPQLKKLSIKKVKTDKIYLDTKELKLIETAIFNEKALDNARDWLIISCETGQRVSDFLRFNKEMIRYQNKKPLIEFTQQKTNKVMTVPLSKKVMSLLKKRKGDFPYKISDQRYNEHIKKVCEDAGLTTLTQGSVIDKKTNRKKAGIFPKWMLVSSHIGRRSFSTNYYGIIPTPLLMGATGHATEQQFLEYIGKSDSQKAMQLADYF